MRQRTSADATFFPVLFGQSRPHNPVLLDMSVVFTHNVHELHAISIVLTLKLSYIKLLCILIREPRGCI